MSSKSEITNSFHITQATIGQMKKLCLIISVVIFPFVEEKWKVLNLDQDAKPLLFFDVLKAQPLLLWPIYCIIIIISEIIIV